MQERNAWWVVVAAALAMIVSNGPINTFAFGVFLKPVATALGLSRGTFSGAMSLALLMTALVIPFFGAAVDRFGFRRCLLVSIPFYVFGIAMLAFMPTHPVGIYTMFALTGLLSVGQTPNAYSKAVAVWFDEHRGLALGVATTGVGLGTILVPQYAAYLIAHVGWRMAYLGLAAAIVPLAWIPVFLLIREPAGGARQTLARTIVDMPGLTRAQAIRAGRFWAITGAFFVAGVVIVGTLSHLVAMLSDRGLSTGATASALSMAGFALIIGRLTAGYALDRIFAPYVTVFFFVCPMTGIALLVFGGSTGMAFVGSMLLGVAIGADLDLVPFLVTRYCGLRSFGQLYGIVFSAFLVGSALGPTLLGVTFDLRGSYRVMLISFEPLLAIGAILLLRLGPYSFPVHTLGAPPTSPVGLPTEEGAYP
jgi:MFS family permease